jgi:hypothetical protein
LTILSCIALQCLFAAQGSQRKVGTAREFVQGAVLGMGGEQKLRGVSAIRYETIGHSLVSGISISAERPARIIYEETEYTIDLHAGSGEQRTRSFFITDCSCA